jgi:hypothetical protein
MRILRIHVGLALLAGSLIATVAAAQAGPETRAPGTKVIRNGNHEAVLIPLEEARAQMGEDERKLLELRAEMRQVRAERREAIRQARESGDPMAMAHVQEEFRPRMEALRNQVRDSREAVMARRLEENPELAARLRENPRARGEGSRHERVECGGTGHADDAARRRAFRRLRGLAPEGTLETPSDIPTAVREELRTHARRVARLHCVRARARTHSDAASSARVRGLLRIERQRHDGELRRLLGAEPAGRREITPGAAEPAQEPAEAIEATEATEEESR